MTADQVSALLFAAWIAAVIAAGLWALWRLLGAEIDRATRLPEHPRPQSLGDDDTTRIDTTLIPTDLPRRTFDRSL